MVMLRADTGSKNIFRLKTGVKQYLAVIPPQIQQILAGLFCSWRKELLVACSLTAHKIVYLVAALADRRTNRRNDIFGTGAEGLLHSFYSFAPNLCYRTAPACVRHSAHALALVGEKQRHAVCKK